MIYDAIISYIELKNPNGGYYERKYSKYKQKYLYFNYYLELLKNFI